MYNTSDNHMMFRDTTSLDLFEENMNNENLYRVLIVDDEESFRVGFRHAINWKDLGFKVAAEASNAADAIKLLEDNYFDIVITDIRMPEKSGLELIQFVRERYPWIRILIVSGYNKFDYAATAIKMNVEDYILKPVKKNNIEERLIKLKSDLDKQRDENIRNNVSKRMARSYFLYHLIQGDFTSKEKILSVVDQLEICLPSDGMYIINLKLDDLRSFVDKYFNGSTESFELAIQKNVEMLTKDPLNDFSIMTFINNNYVFLVSCNEKEIYIRALIVLLEEMDINYRIGVGGKIDSIDYVPVSYHQAIEEIHRHPKNIINLYNDYEDSSDGFQPSQLMLFHKKIANALESGCYHEIPALADNIFIVLENCNINFAYNWAINSIHELLEYFELDKMQKVKITYRFSFFGISEDKILATVKASYLEHLNKIIEALKSFSSEPNQELIKKACEIIERDYPDKHLTLYKVAKELNVSYGYLCTIFKQFTGDNFTDYLISVRMKNARRIILEGSRKMYEIADMVGYSSARYFALSFRKYFGVCPSDYKKRLGGS